MQSRLGNSAMVKNTVSGVINAAVGIRPARRWLVRWGQQRISNRLVVNNEDHMPLNTQKLRVQALRNLLSSIDRAIEERRISPRVRARMVKTFIGNVVTGEPERMRPFRERYGYRPPAFLTISPTKRCNLHCSGCYASSSADNAETLDYEVFSRVLREKKQEWGSHLTVISGGEPFMYRDSGKTILDVFREHSDNYFMVYTNGTLIDDALAQELAELGNVTPAISIEGWEQDTDARRGKGVFGRLLDAMNRLRRHGVPFGISVTATRHNAETLISDEFTDFFFDEMGASYGWVFQYMPIGRSYAVDLMITPEQRKYLLERELELMYEKDRFLVDFWNGGPISRGCIAAGRSGGYFYVDWNGNCAPCVFFPYALKNLYEMYEQGETITDVLETDYFQALRKWQFDYTGRDGTRKVQNLYMTCPIRDHHDFARGVIKAHQARPLDNDARDALEDAEYERRMVSYDHAVARLLDPKWEADVVERPAVTGTTVAEAAVSGEDQRILRHSDRIE